MLVGGKVMEGFKLIRGCLRRMMHGPFGNRVGQFIPCKPFVAADFLDVGVLGQPVTLSPAYLGERPVGFADRGSSCNKSAKRQIRPYTNAVLMRPTQGYLLCKGEC